MQLTLYGYNDYYAIKKMEEQIRLGLNKTVNKKYEINTK